MGWWAGSEISQRWPGGAATDAAATDAAACEDLTTDFARIVSREQHLHQNRGTESRAVHVRTHSRREGRQRE